MRTSDMEPRGLGVVCLALSTSLMLFITQRQQVRDTHLTEVNAAEKQAASGLATKGTKQKVENELFGL